MVTLSKEINILSDGSVLTRSQSNSIYIKVKSSWDFYGKSRPTQNNNPLGVGRPSDLVTTWIHGLPDVWRVRVENLKSGTKLKPDTIELDYDKQHWLLKIQLDFLTQKVHTKAEYFEWVGGTQFLSMARELTSACTKYRSHTNGQGMDNMANFLLGERLELGLPKFAQLVTGRFTGKAILENGKPKVRNLSPEGQCVAVECVNSKVDIWQFSPVSHWWLFDMPLITAREVQAGKDGLSILRDNLHLPYPQFSNLLVFPIWTYQDDVAWVPLNQTTQVPINVATNMKTWIR